MSEEDNKSPEEYSNSELVSFCAVDNGWAAEELGRRLETAREIANDVVEDAKLLYDMQDWPDQVETQKEIGHVYTANYQIKREMDIVRTDRDFLLTACLAERTGRISGKQLDEGEMKLIREAVEAIRSRAIDEKLSVPQPHAGAAK